MKRDGSSRGLFGFAGALLLLTTSCAPQARVSVPTVPLPEKTEIKAPGPPAPAEKDFASGANAGQEETAAAAQPQVVVKERFILPDPQMYAARFRHYGELKEKYDELLFHLDWLSTEVTSPELGRCVAEISGLVDGYGQVMARKELSDGSDQSGEIRPWRIVWQDLAFVQGSCPELYQAKVKEIAGQLQEYKGDTATQAGELVAAYAAQKNDEKAIESFKYLTKNFPEWQRDPAILRQYGEALLRQGQLQEASDIFSELLRDSATVKETIALYRKCANLLLAVGKTDEAARQFRVLQGIEQESATRTEATAASLDLLEGRQKKEPLLSIYRNFLREYYSSDGQKLTTKASTALSQMESFFPESPLTDNARQLFASMQEKVQSSVEEQLALASRLAEEKKFDQAKQMLSSLKTDGLSAELAEKVQFKLQEIIFDEQEEQKSSAWAQEQELEQLWQQATQYFDQHRFDETIAACAAFVGTQYEQQAAGLISKAVDQAAVDLRRQAAALYLKARKENNMSRRGGYLQESLALLREIENKYPQATVIEKVKSNIDVLEGEIRDLGISDDSTANTQ